LLPFAAALCLFNSAVKRLKEDTLILVWMIVVLAVFTFAQTKLYYYILPAFPAFAIVISSLLYRTAEKGYSFFLTVFKRKHRFTNTIPNASSKAIH